ncbi:MAG: cytochrome c maturation protein CcmE [Capsulimonadaceae bacterium]
MKISSGKLIGMSIIVACLGGSAVLFKQSLIDYVPFAQAARATDTTVQIMGAPVSGSMFYDDAAHMLHFNLADGAGAVMPVVYRGPKPEDLDTAAAKATKITAQGTYDPRSHTFVADNLLVKCPSKYQGNPDQERSYKSG